MTTVPAGFDVIGDVHGHAAELEALLRTMGYANVVTVPHRRP